MPLWAEVIIRHRQKWIKEFFGVCLVSMMRVFNNYYGFGWFLGEIRGHKYADHGGVIPSGFTCDIIRFSGDRLTIIVLTNRSADEFLAPDAPRPWDIAKGVARSYVPALTEKVR